MRADFTILKPSRNLIIIEDTTQDYVPEGEHSPVLDPNCFTFLETHSLDIVERMNLDGSTDLIGTFFSEHKVVLHHLTDLDDDVIGTDSPEVKLTEDGYYSITHLILPSKKCLEENLDNPDYTWNDVRNRDNIFVIDIDGKILKYIPLLGEFAYEEIDPKSITPSCSDTISMCCKSTFLINDLEDCYIDACKEILNSGLNQCEQVSNNNSLSLFRRDYLWMCINVIKYYVSFGLYMEALRVLKNVTGCNGLCNKNNKSKKSSKCGCCHHS